jgi:hypothetical protein
MLSDIRLRLAALERELGPDLAHSRNSIEI